MVQTTTLKLLKLFLQNELENGDITWLQKQMLSLKIIETIYIFD